MEQFSANNKLSKEDINFLYEKLWQDGLSEIMSEKKAKEIAMEFLIPDRIDSFAFASNYGTFLRKGFPSFELSLFPDQVKDFCTASINEASKPTNYIPSFPDWFITAYPDVFIWFSNEQHERVRNRENDEDIDDVIASLVCELFEINPEDEKLQTHDLYGSDNKWLPELLKNLVFSYKRKTGKKPETSIDETKNNSIKEIYENIDITVAMAESGTDNFTIIARKTTMYYLELTRNYKKRFKDEVYLLATAGVLDAQVYVFINKNIAISEIIELAEDAIANEDTPLTDFVVKLETKMFTIDTPELPPDVTEKSCQEAKPRIHKEIERIRKEYKRDSLIAKEVKAFMESANFKQVRSQVGVMEKKWWLL